MLWHLNCLYAFMLILSLSPVHCVQKRAIDLNEVADFEDIIEEEAKVTENTVSNSLKKIEAIELELPESLKTVLSLSNVTYEDLLTTSAKELRRRQAILTTARPTDNFDAPRPNVDDTNSLLKFKMRQMKTRVLPNFLTRRRKRKKRYLNLSPLVGGSFGKSYLGNLAAATNDAYLKMQNYAATMVILITTKSPSEYIFTQAARPAATTTENRGTETTQPSENTIVQYKNDASSTNENKPKPSTTSTTMKKYYVSPKPQKVKKHQSSAHLKYKKEPALIKHRKVVGRKTTVKHEIDDALLMADTFGSLYVADKKHGVTNRNYRTIFESDDQLNSFATIPNNMNDLLRVYQTPITESKPHEIDKLKDLSITSQELSRTKSANNNVLKENAPKRPVTFTETAVRTTNPYSWENEILKAAKVKFKKNALLSPSDSIEQEHFQEINKLPTDNQARKQPKSISQNVNPQKIQKPNNPSELTSSAKFVQSPNNDELKHQQNLQKVLLQKHFAESNKGRPCRVLPQKSQARFGQSKPKRLNQNLIPGKHKLEIQNVATSPRSFLEQDSHSNNGPPVEAQVRDIQTTMESTEPENTTISLPFIFTKSISEIHENTNNNTTEGANINVQITTLSAAISDSSTDKSNDAEIKSNETTIVSSDAVGASADGTAISDTEQKDEQDCDKLLEKETNLFNKASDCDKEMEDDDKGTGGFDIPTKEDAEKFLKMNLRNTNSTDMNDNSTDENSLGNNETNSTIQSDSQNSNSTDPNIANDGCDSHDDDDSDSSCDEGNGDAPHVPPDCVDNKQKAKKIKPKQRPRRQALPSTTIQYTLIKIPSANIPVLPLVQQQNKQIRAIEPTVSILPPISPVTNSAQTNNSVIAKKSLDRNVIDTVIENLKTVDQKLAEAVEPLHSAQESLDAVTKCESTTASCEHPGANSVGENNVLADISDSERTALQKLAHKIINSNGSPKFKRSGTKTPSDHKQHKKPSGDTSKIAETKEAVESFEDYYDADELNEEMKRLQRDLTIANELESIMKHIEEDNTKIIKARNKRDNVKMDIPEYESQFDEDPVLTRSEQHHSLKNTKQKKEYTGLFIPGDNEEGMVNAYKKQSKGKKKRKKKKGSIWRRLFGKRDPDEENRFLNQSPQNSQYVRS